MTTSDSPQDPSRSEPARLPDRFVAAIESQDTAEVARLLRREPSLAGTDPRPLSERDRYTTGYPLVRAVRVGSEPIVRLLLDAGADPNAACGFEEPYEFGMPLHTSIEFERYHLAHVLLDYGASVRAYPYCDRPTVDRICDAASDAPPEMFRRGVECYLGPAPPVPLPKDASAATGLLDRFLELDARPSMMFFVRAGRLDVIEDLLRTCPDASGSPHDYPHGPVLHTVAGAASWTGAADVLLMCLELCGEHFDAALCRRWIESAMISHNRDGDWTDYARIIRALLERLRSLGALEALRTADDFRPFHLLAVNYCWPRNYGFRAGVSTPEGMVGLARLLFEYGFDGANEPDPKTGMTPAETALARKGHPCMGEFAAFVRVRG